MVRQTNFFFGTAPEWLPEKKNVFVFSFSGAKSGRANLQEWVLRIHGTRTDPGRSMRSSSTGGSSGRGSQGQSTSATLSKASNGPPSSISNQKAITTPLAMLTPTSAVVTIPAANESVVSIPVIPGSGTTATWDPSGTAAAKDGGSNQGQVKGGHNMDVGPRHDSVLRSKTGKVQSVDVAFCLMMCFFCQHQPPARGRLPILICSAACWLTYECNFRSLQRLRQCAHVFSLHYGRPKVVN